MTVNDLIQKLNATACVLADGNREVTGGYAGDFLSYVMARAPGGSAWFTVMTNINVAAVATLSDVAVVVVCENCEPDITLLDKAADNGINVIKTGLDIFSAIRLF